MNMHEIIRNRRRELGLTQEQLAGKLGVSAPAVNKWERAGSYPDITLLPVLARTLGVDLNTLLSFQEDLTDQEIGMFLNTLHEAARAEGFDADFARAEEKLREFPGNDRLAYSVAVLLEGLLCGGPEQRQEEIGALYERCRNSADPQVREWAVHALAIRLLERMLRSLASPWDLSESPLYRHLLTKDAAGEAQTPLISLLLDEVERDQACAFLWELPEYRALLQRWRTL